MRFWHRPNPATTYDPDAIDLERLTSHGAPMPVTRPEDARAPNPSNMHWHWGNPVNDSTAQEGVDNSTSNYNDNNDDAPSDATHPTVSSSSRDAARIKRQRRLQRANRILRVLGLLLALALVILILVMGVKRVLWVEAQEEERGRLLAELQGAVAWAKGHPGEVVGGSE